MNILRSVAILSTLYLILSFRTIVNEHVLFKSNLVSNFVVFSIDNVLGDHKNQRLDLYYHDSLAYGHPVDIGVSGRKIFLNSPTFLFEASDKQTPFLIFPGEKINIRYSGTDSIQLYVIGNQQRTNELNFFRKLVQKTGNLYYVFKRMPYLQKVSSLSELGISENLINKKKRDRLSFLSAYLKEFPTGAGFNSIAINAIKSTALNDSLLLFSHNKALLAKNDDYKKLVTDKLTAINYIGYMPFQFYFRTCNTLSSMFLYDEESHIMRNGADFVKKFNFSEHFSGKTKDFLMAHSIYDAIANNINISKMFIEKFHRDCKDIGYNGLIDKKLIDKKKSILSDTPDELAFINGRTVGLQTIISRNRGKILLLDFWASWCVPCRAEMPYCNLLKAKYRNKQIVFISISEDQDRNSWLTANKEEALGEQNSFFLLRIDNSSFVKRFHITTIPRYLLVGKDGSIISDDAPRPSDPKLTELIDKNL